MSHAEPDTPENYLERLFWEFDGLRKKDGDERRMFKIACCSYAAYLHDTKLRAEHGFEPAEEPKPLEQQMYPYKFKETP